MNKSLNDYLTESKTEYPFRLKFAVEVTDQMIDALEVCLEKFNVQSVSKVHKTIMQKHPMDFATLPASEIYMIDVVLEYPVTDHALQSYIVSQVAVPASHLVVRSPNHPEEVANDAVQAEDDANKTKPQSLLDSDYDDTVHEIEFGDAYNEKLLANINTERKERIFDVLNFETDPTSDIENAPEDFSNMKPGTRSPISGDERK
jgi:hypothetical protein